MTEANQDIQQDIDWLFLALMKDLLNQAKEHTRHSVSKILDISSSYLGDEAHRALKDFHHLYFGDEGIDAKKKRINDDVTRIVDEVKELVDAEADPNQVGDMIQEDQDLRLERLGIAALQKKLEVLISLEESFRAKMTPIIGSLQFEDAMTQRLAHLEYAWSAIIGVADTASGLAPEDLARDIASQLSSDGERELFYPIVLKEHAPEGVGERSIWLDLVA